LKKKLKSKFFYLCKSSEAKIEGSNEKRKIDLALKTDKKSLSSTEEKKKKWNFIVGC
jgi:hypothetical protein